MDIRTFTSVLRKNRLWLFTSRELRFFAGAQSQKTMAVQLHQWVRKGWVLRLKRGLYELAYPEPVFIPDFYLANRLYAPSYVSLDTALSNYQIIPEFAAQVTSVTSKPTRRFSNRHGLFTYFTVMSKAFAGYRIQKVNGFDVLMAELEKAVVDRLYAALRRGEQVGSLCSRWDWPRLKKANRRKLLDYASLFSGYQKKLVRCLNAFPR